MFPSRWEERSTATCVLSLPPLLSFLLLAFFRTLPSSILAAHTFWGRTRTSNEVLLFLWRPYREHVGPSRGCERQLQWELTQNERDRSAPVMPSHRRSWAFSSPTTEQHKWHANSENARQKLPDHYKHVKKEEN